MSDRGMARRAVWRRTLGLAIALAAGAGGRAHAQQGTQTPTAVLPAKGVLSAQQLVQYRRYRSDPTGLGRDVDDWVSITRLTYGLRHDLAVMVDVPVFFRRQTAGGRTRHDTGQGDIRVLATWRVYRNDFGPIDTTRVAVVGGLDLDTAHAPFGGNSFDPIVGAALTHITGRHGFNASTRWTLNTGGRANPVGAGNTRHDLLAYDLAYLFRLLLNLIRIIAL